MIEEVILSNLITLQRGFDITKKEQSEGSVPVISSGGISSLHNQYKVEGPGVIVGRKGTLGTVFYTEGNFWPHDTSLWVKDFKGNDPKFIYYLLQVLHFEKFDAWAANPTLNRNHVHSLKLRVPKKQYRTKIASILSAYDDLIENNNQRIKLLEEMAEEIYKEWFVRMRFPNYKTTKFYDKEGKEVAHGTKDALPEGWENGNIGSLFKVKSGFAFPSTHLGDNGVPVIKIRNIDNLNVDTINCDRFSGDINERVAKFRLEDLDLLIAMTGATIGKVALFIEQAEPYYLNQRVGKYFSADDESSGKSFIYQFSKTLIFKESINNCALGAAQPNISGEQIENIKLLIPSKEILEEFESITLGMIKEISILKSKNQLLQETRDLLLPRLISGKLNVEDLKEYEINEGLDMVAEP